MLFFIQVVVLSDTLVVVSVEGAAGRMKSVRRVACLCMPGGNVLVEMALLMMPRWWVACISLK